MPRADANRIEGVVGGALRARVTAPPVDGAANDALTRLLAETLDLPRSCVRLVSGATSRDKVIEIDGLVSADLKARWPGLDV